jgi:hypothetical protein
MTEQAQDFSKLVADGKAELAPVAIDDEHLKQMAATLTPIVVHEVTENETEYGSVYEVTFMSTSDDRYYLKSLWSNKQRDPILQSLMRNLADGPIGGLRFQAQGSGKKVFFVLVPV